VGDKRVAEYSYIPPGRYTFRVRACNSDGVWNRGGAAIALVVPAAFLADVVVEVLTTLAAIGFGDSIVWYYFAAAITSQTGKMFSDNKRLSANANDRQGHSRPSGANLTRISLLSQSAQGDLENPPAGGDSKWNAFTTPRAN